MSVSELSNIAGLLSLGITIFVAIVGAFYMVRSGVGQQTNEAQESAIGAMQAEIAVLDKRLEDLRDENKRLERILGTITTALKLKGITITIHNDVVNIEIEDQQEHKKSMTIRISDESKDSQS